VVVVVVVVVISLFIKHHWQTAIATKSKMLRERRVLK